MCIRDRILHFAHHSNMNNVYAEIRIRDRNLFSYSFSLNWWDCWLGDQDDFDHRGQCEASFHILYILDVQLPLNLNVRKFTRNWPRILSRPRDRVSLPLPHSWLLQAALKMDRTVSKSSRIEKISKLMREMGIKKLASSHVCDLSGGERRRLSIAVQVQWIKLHIEHIRR